MGFWGQEQQWVAVQEKTFTKWSVCIDGDSATTNTINSRLNSKITVREVSVNDLVTDLSDGVGTPHLINWEIGK